MKNSKYKKLYTGLNSSETVAIKIEIETMQVFKERFDENTKKSCQTELILKTKRYYYFRNCASFFIYTFFALLSFPLFVRLIKIKLWCDLIKASSIRKYYHYPRSILFTFFGFKVPRPS